MMMKTGKVIVIALLGFLSTEVKAQNIWDLFVNEVNKTVAQAGQGLKAAQTWSQTAINDLDNYTTATGQSFQDFTRQTENIMASASTAWLNEMTTAVNTLQNLTNLQCNEYTQPVMDAIKSMPTSLDNYGQSEAGANECKQCMAWATQEFLCQVPQILEGNISLIKRFNEAMQKKIVKDLPDPIEPAGAVASMVYDDFAESMMFIMGLKDQILSAGEISNPDFTVLYGQAACQMYGSEALGFLMDKLQAENPKRRIEKVTNKILEILGKMDKANTYAGYFDQIREYAKSAEYQAEMESVLPKAPSLYGNGALIGTGWFPTFERIITSNNGYFYGIKANGDFHGYDHMVQNTDEWEGGNKIGAGWQEYKNIFAGTDKTIYAIDEAGNLWWYKNTSRSTDGWIGRKRIGTGWQGFKDVKAGSNGMIYAMRNNGELLWYQTADNGTEQWHPKSGTVIGTGWTDEAVKFWGVGQDGVIFRVDSKGDVYWYINTKHGEMEWTNNGYGLLVDSGWQKYSYVFGGKDNLLYGVTPDGDLYSHRFK